MQLEYKKIEQIANNVQDILNNESKKISNIKELETKFNNLQNAMTAPFNSCFEDREESKAFCDYLRKGKMSDFITKSLSTNAGEAGVSIVNSINTKIINQVNARSVMRKISSIDTISTSALDLIIEDGKFNSGWIGEEEARVATNTPKLKKKTIFVHELYAQPKATQKLIDDASIDIESWLSERLIDSFVKAENEAFINGDGDKKPFGILKNADVEKIEVGSEVTADILLKLINKLDEEYIENASFLMNRSTLAAIQSLKDETGRFIWQQSLSEPLNQTIFGIPVLCSSYMPNVEDQSLAIAIGDFKTAYKIVDRENISVMRDQYTEKPFVKFYAVKRVGGDVILPSALKFAKFSS
jgi:HK97 family phage major capsid protein